jgi:hypothetical protein
MSSRPTPPSVFYEDFALVPRGASAGKPKVSFSRPVNLLSAASTPSGGQASPATSAAHVLVLNLDGQLYIRDLTGTASLQCNGKSVVEAKLTHGDQVRLGKIEYEVFATRLAAGANNSQPTAPPAAALVPTAGGEERPMRDPVTLVGACEQAELRLLTAGAPEACAMILRLGAGYWLWNLDATFPCRINGEPVVRAPLADGSVVSIGDEDFRFRLLPRGETKPKNPQVVKVVKAKAPMRAAPVQADPVAPAAPTAPAISAKTRAVPNPAVASVPISGAVANAPTPAAPPPPQRALATAAPTTPRTPDESELRDDADVFKQWGPLAFAVAAADRPELQPGGSKSGSRSNANAAEAVAAPAPPKRSLVKVVIIVMLLALLAGGAYVSWKYGMRFLRT